MMQLLLFLSRAFIQTFGITQPTPERERRIAWMLAALMLLVVTVVAVVGVALHGWFVNR
ncbi:MAG: hypothetical protein INR62_13130 [Rhodospirillales bacterium]|nr:hypothetical protein [Acetobacter sp.]